MEEGLKEGPDNIEAEANLYVVNETFITIEKLKEKAQNPYRNNFPIYFLIDKDGYKFYLSLKGHAPILRNNSLEGAIGGVIRVNKELNVTEITGDVGTASVRDAPTHDFPLIKKIAQKYLDGVKRSES